jgi:hypothetical protein
MGLNGLYTDNFYLYLYLIFYHKYLGPWYKIELEETSSQNNTCNKFEIICAVKSCFIAFLWRVRKERLGKCRVY